MNREEYRRRKGSTVWHFLKDCRYWPTMERWMGKLHISEVRPRTGTLCDTCQAIERKEKVARLK